MLVPPINVLRARLTRSTGKWQTFDPKRSYIWNLISSLLVALLYGVALYYFQDYCLNYNQRGEFLWKKAV